MPKSASTVSSNFTKYLKELAQSKGKTLTSVAKSAQVSTGYMSNLLTGRKSSPSLDICKRLAVALLCTPEERRDLLEKAGHDPEEAILPPPVIPPKVVTAKISEIPRPKKVTLKVNDGFLYFSKSEDTLSIEAKGAIGSLVANIELEGMQIAQVPISQGLYKFSGFDPGASLRIQIIEPNGDSLFDGTL